MIDINKKYRTRDGREVRIYATDAGGKQPVHGAYLSKEGAWKVTYWKEEGMWVRGQSTNLDLIEIREKKKISGWVNIYPDGDLGGVYISKEKADRAASARRIACKYIEIEYEEGEGL